MYALQLNSLMPRTVTRPIGVNPSRASAPSHQRIDQNVLEKYSGGPVGLTTIAASIDEEPGTIEEVYEPYLLQLGFLDRTPRGRVGTERAFEHFGVARRMRGTQNSLF
jgi:Holliday junction DNA helicase RuvB